MLLNLLYFIDYKTPICYIDLTQGTISPRLIEEEFHNDLYSKPYDNPHRSTTYHGLSIVMRCYKKNKRTAAYEAIRSKLVTMQELLEKSTGSLERAEHHFDRAQKLADGTYVFDGYDKTLSEIQSRMNRNESPEPLTAKEQKAINTFLAAYK